MAGRHIPALVGATAFALLLDLFVPSSLVGSFATLLQTGVISALVLDLLARKPWRSAPWRATLLEIGTLLVASAFVLAKIDVLVEAGIGAVPSARAVSILRSYGVVIALASGVAIGGRATERMAFLSRLALRPVQTIVLSYGVAIVLGTLLLSLPMSLRATEDVSLFDALFVTTSAISVTGLSVVHVPSTYSGFGLFVLMVLLQLGGLGIMSLFAAFAVLSGRRLSAKSEMELSEAVGGDSRVGFLRSLRFIVVVALGIECIGALLLLPSMLARMDAPAAAFHALFLSISAFCNAGVSALPDGVEGLSTPTLGVVALLVVLGGLGTPVLLPLWLRLRGGLHVLGLHAKLALATSLTLLAVGALGFLLLEGGRGFSAASWGESIGHSLFLSASARTSGFQIASLLEMSPAGLAWLGLLGLVGASPGSTGGGLKTTTFAVLTLSIVAVLRRRDEVTAFGRTVPKEDILRAMALLWSALALLVLGVLALLAIVPERPLAAAFEAVNAFTTTGMSLGLTPELPPAGRIVVMMLMIVGRLGPLTLLAAFFDRRSPAGVHYPSQHVQFG